MIVFDYDSLSHWFGRYNQPNDGDGGDGGDDDGRIGGGRRGDGNDGRRPLITVLDSTSSLTPLDSIHPSSSFICLHSLQLAVVSSRFSSLLSRLTHRSSRPSSTVQVEVSSQGTSHRPSSANFATTTQTNNAMSSQGGTSGDVDELVDSGGIGGGGKVEFDFELVELRVKSKKNGGMHIHRGNPQTAIVGEPSRHVSPPFDLTIACTACLGSGSYGIVWLARENVAGSFVAVKRCRVHLKGPNAREKAVREILALQKLSGHKNIVTMIDFKIEKEENNHLPLSIVFEFVKGGSLETYRKSQPNSCLSEKEMQLVLLDVAMGMRHMHDNFIVSQIHVSACQCSIPFHSPCTNQLSHPNCNRPLRSTVISNLPTSWSSWTTSSTLKM